MGHDNINLWISLEGFHSGFQNKLRQASPNFFRMVEALKSEHLAKSFLIQQISAGHPPPPKKARYVAANNRLKAAVQSK